MREPKEKGKLNKLPSILMLIFVLLVLIISLIISANRLIEYVAIKSENDVLIDTRENLFRQIDELKYYLDAEINTEYKERMARLLGYCYPDESIFYIE